MHFSFEMFPPQSHQQHIEFMSMFEDIDFMKPNFISIGQSPIENIYRDAFIFDVKQKFNLNICPHLTCVSMSKDKLIELVKKYWEKDIHYILALRGDFPKDHALSNDHFIYTKDFIKVLKNIAPFEIIVAGYPEKHPEIATMEEDILHLKKKIDAGATAIITQFFFDNDAFLKYRDQVEKAGIHVPLIPGIISMTNIEKIKKLSERCNVDMPIWLIEKFQTINPVKYVEEFLLKQCDVLLKEGVKGLHFYTLNDPSLSIKICKELGIRG
ncbi:MAG: methylenetetrahydrofolate reductase [Alphaproteobacteria bacterium]|nr:methylenetetrahydrofolate reductase [Alphaproteobacteria bacterium]